MCYSALIEADYRKLERTYGAALDLAAFTQLWLRENAPRRPKTPKALDDAFRAAGPAAITQELAEWDRDQRQQWEAELFAQARRLADAERKLEAKPTKAAANEARIAGKKVQQLKGWLADLGRQAPKPRDSRIYPGMYAPVIVAEDGQRVIRPMRYQCRPAGKPAAYDAKYPGTYNARRDNLEGFWKGQFGRTHGLLVASRFYENVEGPDGLNHVLEFEPRTGEPMLIACLWSHWVDPAGQAPDLLSFAAITDDPEPEVAAAGHDRTIINIKPEHVDAWLNPTGGDLAGLYAIFDDKQHPFYEHRLAA